MIVPLLLAPTVSIVLIVAPVGIPLPVNFCPVPSSKCVRALCIVPTVNVLVPPAGVEIPASTSYVNPVADVTTIVFRAVYSIGVAPVIVTVSPVVSPCADAVTTVAVSIRYSSLTIQSSSSAIK